MTSLGQRLRQERLSRGVDIAAIAAETRICSRYLEAIEADNYDTLPGGFFRRAFVRQYANELGITESEVDAYLQQIEPEARTFMPDPPPKPASPSLWARYSNRAISFGAGALMLAAGGYACWQLVLPARQSDSTQSSPAAPAIVTPQQPPAESATPLKPLPTDTASPAPKSPAPMGTSHAADGATLRLMATEPTWVSVSSQGKTLFVGLLSRDESRNIEGVEQARLLVGNAGGLEVSWRGEPVGPLGPRGRTRIVWLKPEGVEISLPGS